MSFNKGSSSKSSSTQTQQDYGSALLQEQSPYLTNMWAGGNSVLNNMGGAINQSGYDALNQAGNYGNMAGQQYGMMSGMLGQGNVNLGYGTNYNAMGAGEMSGSPWLSGARDTLSRLQNPGVDPMMGVYARQIGQQFNEQIMPGLRGDAAVSGQLGSSRAGIGQALAGARAGQQLQDFGAQLYGQNQDRALQAAGAQGNISGMVSDAYARAATNAGMLGSAYQQGAGVYGQQAEGYRGLGTDALQRGQFGMGIPWFNLNQMSGLLGSPTMQDLGGYSSATSKSKGGGGFGINTGFSFPR